MKCISNEINKTNYELENVLILQEANFFGKVCMTNLATLLK